MNELEQSYALCQRLARRAASNFYFSFLLLPRDKRRGMAALYAFLRQVDDLADDESCDMVSRKQALETLRADLHAALAGQAREPVLLALADTVARFGIPEEYLTAVIDGVEMDLDHKLFETFEDLETYCYRVASVVGLACIHIWGFRGSQALEPARQCGLAFQLTNILRDLKEDAARNRVYLPQEDLRRFGYSIADLQRGTVNSQFDELMQFEISRAERFYQTAEQLEFQLDRDGRRVYRAMMITYRTLLTKIKRRPAEVFSQRIRLSGWEKLRIAADAVFKRASTMHARPPCETVSS